jgi:hypothetical protein
MKKKTPKPMLNSPQSSSEVGMEFLRRVLTGYNSPIKLVIWLRKLLT